jgi:eukaryotic-like serine/threonine-protein kinase
MKFCPACSTEYSDETVFCQRDGTPLRPVKASADLVGQVVAERYLIQRKLGEGGMGQVYLAEHVKMGRRCAIKIMTPGAMNDPDAISRFNREAANASRISHANVCQIYDFGETPDGLIYLAMEFIEGQSLTVLLEETGALSLPRSAQLISQCSEALQAAHDLGIVHRDLKPDNIMVVTARGKDSVKVVDFGIAKAMGQDGGSQKVTKTGFVVGTPEYMSPEQLAGDPVDGRTDIYSLALVFYRCVTGKLPFEAETSQETMIKRLTDDPIPLAVARPDLRFPNALQRVMDRALSRTAADRYASAAEFGRDVLNTAGTAVVGQVDLDAGTQVVRAERSSATVPMTRVDPALAAELAKKKAAARATPAAVPARRWPAGAIAGVVLVLVAGSGAAFAFKDRLLGTSARPDSIQSDSTHRGAGGPGEGKPVNFSNDSDSGQPQVNPAPPGPAPTSARPAPPPPPAGGTTRTVTPTKVAVPLPDIEEIFDAARRDHAREQSIGIYSRTDVLDSLRAEAAALVGQAYNEDKKFSQARDWFDKAIQAFPRDLFRQLKADAERNMRVAGPN